MVIIFVISIMFIIVIIEDDGYGWMGTNKRGVISASIGKKEENNNQNINIKAIQKYKMY